MYYNHKKRTLYTTSKEMRLLKDAKNLLFEMLRCTGGQNKKISFAYQHLSILLEQYRFRKRKRIKKTGRFRRLLNRRF